MHHPRWKVRNVLLAVALALAGCGREEPPEASPERPPTATVESAVTTDMNPIQYTVGDVGTNYAIYTPNYRIVIAKSGFRFSFQNAAGTAVRIGPSPGSGIAFSAPNSSTPLAATIAVYNTKDDNRATFRAKNTLDQWATVYIYPRLTYVKVEIVPDLEGTFTIESAIGACNPAYGLGDFATAMNNSNLQGFADSQFWNKDTLHRFVSTFAICPANTLGMVLFADGRKRVRLDATSMMGVEGVRSLNKMYYFIGAPEQIYSDYKAVRTSPYGGGLRDFKPKYRFFEVGWEAWGSLGWDTYQSSVQSMVQEYLNRGYRLKWGVVGSGFWKGPRTSDTQGATTSFGMWDDTAEAGRNDGLPNPRYPDPNGLKSFFRSRDMNPMLGLRVTFKALREHGGYYTAEYDSGHTPYGLNNGFFKHLADSTPVLYTAHFPAGNSYVLDGRNASATTWYKDVAGWWGVDGFKEDTMLKGNTVGDVDDTNINRSNTALLDAGYYVMSRNAGYAVAGDLQRIEDANYNSTAYPQWDMDHVMLALLAYGASAAPNVYPDVVGGARLPAGGLTDPRQKLYLVRNAILSSLTAGMGLGYPPWYLNDTTLEAHYKVAADLHARFAPYFYSAAVDAYNTGYPYTLTPLPVAFPNDANTYNLANTTDRIYEWMIGPSILAAPLYGNNFDATTRHVYLPAGKWMDFNTGTAYQGPTYLWNFPISTGQWPIFIGGKGVIVFRTSTTNDTLKARVYPIASAGSQYVFTAPDGVTQTRITHENTGWNQATLGVLNTSTGQWVAWDYETKSGAITFVITPGQNYSVRGGS